MMKKNYTQYLTDSAQKRHGINRISVTTKVLLKPLMDNYGKAYVQILLDWPDIIGKHFADVTSFMQLKFPLGKKIDGVLHLRCISAAIPLLQAQSPQIIDRINRYFGYKAVVQIRFQAGLVINKKNKSCVNQIVLSEEKTSEIKEITRTIKDDKLREALERLGAGIFKEEEAAHVKKS
ncbi:MAG: DciA family protein [Candidatus Paracaedibacteraceae bacterium]|nr:DciA family protein [Candidatus Paracaedibacteraceae bacterium]